MADARERYASLMDHDVDLELKEMFRKLYPRLNADEREDARANLDRYIRLSLRIFERTSVQSDTLSGIDGGEAISLG